MTRSRYPLTHPTRSRLSLAAALALAPVIASAPKPACANAEYFVAPGDVLELRVLAAPDISQRSQVQQDGTVPLSGLGNIRVAGLKLSEMRAKIEAAVASKVFLERSSDGQQHVVALHPNDVAVTIAEYRPVYVSGDVLNPGQFTFRPSITVRQIVALAGGYSLLHNRAIGSDNNPLELQGQLTSVGAQLAKNKIHAARLQAELEGRKDISPAGDITLPRYTASDLYAAETESLRISQTSHEQEKAFLLNAIERTDQQIATLAAEQSEEEQGLQAEQQDLARANKAFAVGELPSPRISESRREVLASSTRKLQTVSSLIQIRLQRDELVLKLAKLSGDRRVGLLEALSRTRVEIVEAAARLASLRGQLDLLASSAASGQNDPAEIGIARGAGQQWTTQAADVDSELQPGDVVTVRIKTAPELLPGQAGY